ncbi:DUF2802 domain-containing protein [Ferrimonas marina]|uniref:DUF2802 domain-containing protein n=1 Tax=Ferrimonas marina TaxID=299255 RepID=A0A1M5YEG5_9GAMM|nr:DUF2802 domain-containing protein [Ferrimonas marina]SHI10294.1 Protein of unknown function [Ferrimonas marina]
MLWIPAAVAALALLFLLVCLWQLRQARLRMAQLERQCEALKLVQRNAQSNSDSLQRELAEIRTGALGVGRRVKEIEQHLDLLKARQDEVAQTDPEARLYNRAMKMVELGADVDEIMRECELPRAEAQLLVTLHRRGE